MLKYTSLFDDLDELYRSAGNDPRSFRRLSREVDRVSEDLDEYYGEVAYDYVIRLVDRLDEPGATLTDEQVTLLRGFLGLPPRDPARDAHLIDALASLEQNVSQMLALKDRHLSLKNLNALRRLLDRMKAALPPIVHVLEERERVRRFEEAVEGGEKGREWLVIRMRRALEGADPASITSSDEIRIP